MKRLIALAVAAISGLGLLGVEGSAGAVVPGTNGRILYSRAIWRAGRFNWQLETAEQDGTNITVLATFPGDAIASDEMFANWSPDANTVLLNLYNAVWEVNADGTDLHELISCSSLGVYCGSFGGFGEASFTPDGEHIVVGHCCTKGDGIYALNPDGTAFKAIRTGGAGFGNPQVSPDGRTIAFSRCPDNTPGCLVGTMNINGGNVRMLTDGSENWDFPNWSPDSKHIVVSGFNGGSANIAVVDADGTGFHQLTSDPKTFSVWACFSPDGTELLFSRFKSTAGWDLYTMSPDGTGVTQETHSADRELWPQWAALT
jgi:Tol biopolymer transport system component